MTGMQISSNCNKVAELPSNPITSCCNVFKMFIATSVFSSPSSSLSMSGSYPAPSPPSRCSSISDMMRM